MKTYAASDTKTVKGLLLTSDDKYVICPDGDSGFSYWHAITSINKDVIKGVQIGHCGYDYCFYSQENQYIEDNLKVLNHILSK